MQPQDDTSAGSVSTAQVGDGNSISGMCTEVESVVRFPGREERQEGLVGGGDGRVQGLVRSVLVPDTFEDLDEYVGTFKTAVQDQVNIGLRELGARFEAGQIFRV